MVIRIHYRSFSLFVYDTLLLMMKYFKKIAFLILLFALPLTASAQCAMCRAVLESDADGGAAKGINDGIIYLMIWPYLLIGGVGFLIYRMIRKSVKN